MPLPWRPQWLQTRLQGGQQRRPHWLEWPERLEWLESLGPGLEELPGLQASAVEWLESLGPGLEQLPGLQASAVEAAAAAAVEAAAGAAAAVAAAAEALRRA